MRVLDQNPAPHLKVQRYSPIAQLVERLTVNQNVRGSSPRRGAKQEKALYTRAFFVEFSCDWKRLLSPRTDMEIRYSSFVMKS